MNTTRIQEANRRYYAITSEQNTRSTSSNWLFKDINMCGFRPVSYLCLLAQMRSMQDSPVKLLEYINAYHAFSRYSRYRRMCWRHSHRSSWV